MQNYQCWSKSFIISFKMLRYSRFSLHALQFQSTLQEAVNPSETLLKHQDCPNRQVSRIPAIMVVGKRCHPSTLPYIHLPTHPLMHGIYYSPTHAFAYLAKHIQLYPVICDGDSKIDLVSKVHTFEFGRNTWKITITHSSLVYVGPTKHNMK